VAQAVAFFFAFHTSLTRGYLLSREQYLLGLYAFGRDYSERELEQLFAVAAFARRAAYAYNFHRQFPLR